MSRAFSRAGVIDFGDVTAARFLVDTAWTFIIFVRFGNTASDDNCIVSKWTSSSSNRQILIRVDLGTAPQGIEVYINGATLEINSADVIELDTWYCVAISNAGTSNASGLTLNVAEMDGTLVVDAQTGSGSISNSLLTAPIKVGQTDASSDPMDGDAFGVIYVDAEITQAEFLAYVQAPYEMGPILKQRYGVHIGAWLEGDDSPEPDWSGNGNNGTVTGAIKGPNPNVTPPVFSHNRFLELAAGATVNADHAVAASWLAGRQADAAIPASWLTDLTADYDLPASSGATLVADVDLRASYGRLVEQDALLPASWLAAADSDHEMPAEWAGAIQVDVSAVIPVEWRASLAADHRLPVESRATMLVDKRIVAEYGRAVETDVPAFVEWLAGLAADQEVEVSWTSVPVTVSDHKIPVEWGGSPFVPGTTQGFAVRPRSAGFGTKARPGSFANPPRRK